MRIQKGDTMTRQKPDKDYCEGCEHFAEKMTKCVPNGCQKHLEVEICEGCNQGILWERVLDCHAEITEGNGILSFWGAPCEEQIVVGYECPLCGHKNDF